MNWVQRFATWEAFLDHCENAPVTLEVFRHRDNSRANYSSGFAGQTWAETVRDARYGSVRLLSGLGLDKATALYNAIGSRIARVEYEYAVTGEILDIGAYVSGEPECWLGEREDMVKGYERKHVNMLIHTGITGHADKELYEQRGRAMFVAVALMERMGWAVTIDAGSLAIADDKGTATVITRVKSPDQPINLARLAFVLTDVGMHRRLTFAWRETCPHKALGEGLRCMGRSAPFDAETRAGYDVVTRPLDNPSCTEWDDVEGWVVRFLGEQGVELTLEGAK